MLAVNRRTTGEATIVPSKAGDLELFSRVSARSLAIAGDEPGKTLHNAYAALIYETIGCSMTVSLVQPGEAPRLDGGKIQRVRDLGQ
jgi:phenylacetate-coenzyme A ligase PaaK-like adenylate-forming protein